MPNTYPVCPFWCTWEHTALSDGVDVVIHETQAGQVELSTGVTLAAVIEATDEEPTPVVSLYGAANLTGLSADDIRALDRLLAGARDRLMQALATLEG